MDILKETALQAIDPYKAVDLMGQRRLTFKNKETFIKADKLLKEYLAAHKEKKKTILDYLYNGNGKA
jgi:hypothetical protein